jgi:hypothetical protein
MARAIGDGVHEGVVRMRWQLSRDIDEFKLVFYREGIEHHAFISWSEYRREWIIEISNYTGELEGDKVHEIVISDIAKIPESMNARHIQELLDIASTELVSWMLWGDIQ